MPRTFAASARIVETSSRQFADVIVAVPVGRVDHHNADKLEAALSPLVKEASRQEGRAGAGFRRRRVHQQRRPPDPDDRGEAVALVRRQDRRRESAAGGGGDLRHQPVRSRPRRVPDGARRDRAVLQRRRSRPTTRRRRRPRDEARAFLGHARLAARRAHRRRRAAEDRLGAARSVGPHLRVERRCRALRRRPRVRGVRNLRRTYVLRRARDRRPGVRDLRSRQRRAPVRPGRDRTAWSAVAADVSRLRVPCALGSHHGAAVLHAGLHSRATASTSTAATRGSSRRCAASRTSRRFRWISRSCTPTSISSTSSPSVPMRSRA